MSDQNVYTPGIAIGSTDWAGGQAPGGGTHTGRSIITMVDNATFAVAHSVAEVQRKLDLHAVAPPSQGLSVYVAFDRYPLSGTPQALNVANIRSVS